MEEILCPHCEIDRNDVFRIGITYYHAGCRKIFTIFSPNSEENISALGQCSCKQEEDNGRN